jgi:hypothetical protein
VEDPQLRNRFEAFDAAARTTGGTPSSREDPEVARGILTRIFPGPGPRKAALGVLADVIEHAHAQGSARWAVTLFENLARLNVGAVPPVDLAGGCVALMLDERVLDSTTRERLGIRVRGRGEFQLVQHAMTVCIPAEEIAETWPRLKEACFAMTRQAAGRETSFWKSHSPGVLRYVSTEIGRELPSRDTRSTALDVDEVLKRSRRILPDERIAIRKDALTEAHDLIQAGVRALTAEQITHVLQLFHLDFENGRKKSGRFGMAFTGASRNNILADLEHANEWIAAIWSARADEELARTIDELRKRPLRGAGWSMLSLVAHAKDPSRYFPCSGGVLTRGIRALVGVSVVDGASYVEACRRLRDFCAAHDLSPHGLDIAVWQAADFASAAAAPTKAPTSAVPEATSATSSPTLYDRAAFLRDTALDDAELADIEALLDDKPQLVLYGPPGTGKTFIAERLGRWLAGEDGFVRTVQFHPSYGYEDFIEGIRPTVDDSGSRVTYPVEKGLFRRFCLDAAERSGRCVLVIDEINRGNLPRIFGELLFLLERRGQAIDLPVSREQMVVPPNVVLLGTMNTADQSIALLDMALRRRFHFKRLDPSADALRRWLRGNAPALSGIAEVVRELNARLHHDGVDRDRFIGHSHFMRPGLDDDKLRRIWEHSIVPTLEELFHGRTEKLDRYDYETLVSPLLAQSEPIADDEALE